MWTEDMLLCNKPTIIIPVCAAATNLRQVVVYGLSALAPETVPLQLHLVSALEVYRVSQKKRVRTYGTIS